MNELRKRITRSAFCLICFIIATTLIIAGITVTLIGVFSGNGAAFAPDFDAFGITDGDIGSRVSGEVGCECMSGWETDKGQFYILFINGSGGELSLIGFDVPKSCTAEFSFPREADGIKYPYFSGTVRAADSELREKIRKHVSDYYERLFSAMEEQGKPVDNADETFRLIAENLSPYYIEVADAGHSGSLIGTGIVLLCAGIMVLLAVLIGKVFVLISAGTAVTLTAVFFIAFGGKIATMASITRAADGLYTMDCKYDYNCDGFLNADRSTIEDMIRWIEDTHFFGIRIEYDASNFGCSAFTAAAPDGSRLFGRNFDYSDTDTLVVYTHPEGGYASFSNVDMRFFDVGEDRRNTPDSLFSKTLMTLAPYFALDGINEAGVGAAVLQLDIPELHQDNGKPDLLVSAAIRGILDKCASVDEAIALLESYDIHTYLNRSYHLFITDRSGRSVVVEWNRDKTLLVEDTACTNDVLSTENEFYEPDRYCKRYDTIKRALEEKSNVLTEEEAMEVLSEAKRTDTQWSCIYDLDSFSFTECIDRDYGTVYRFDRASFS